MILKDDFATFLHEIRPTDAMKNDLKTGHSTLRQRLRAYEATKDIIVSDFLQGSYRRHTAVRPKGERRSDVDIIIVTKLHESEYLPSEAMDIFVPFLNKYYKGKWRRQGRSFGIEMSYVELDLVITSAPLQQEIGILKSEAVTTDEDIVEALNWRLHRSWLSTSSRWRSNAQLLLAEAENQPEWKAQSLRIPDREAETWNDTHPIAQIQWARDKNASCNGHYVNVVKAIKWWRLEKHEEPKHPKGFPLERLIGEHCPDGINSVAEGVVRTLESIVDAYRLTVHAGKKPCLPDHGVETHDVFQRVSAEDFAKFYEQVKESAMLARRAYDSQDRTESGNLWWELFGSKFPKPPNGGSKKQHAFSPPSRPAVPGSGRFA